MPQKDKKQKRSYKPPVYYEFQKAKAIDGAKLFNYYQPKQPSYNIERFNRIELEKLKITTKRDKFDWALALIGFIGGLIGTPKITISTIFVIFVNLLMFWGILLVEFIAPEFRLTREFLYCLFFILPFLIANQMHIYWKTKDVIELSKLTQRSQFLETRLASTLVNYIKANVIFVIILRWFFENQIVSFSGIGLDSIWSWLSMAFDNMILLLAVLDYTSIVGYSGFSTIKPASNWSMALIWLIILFNHFIGLESIKCILQVIERNGRLPSLPRTFLKAVQRLL